LTLLCGFLFYAVGFRPCSLRYIIRWLFSSLLREHRTLAHIRVNEDGALICSPAFCKSIRDEEGLNLETTGGYASYINGKIAHTNRTVVKCVRCFIPKSAQPKQDWCYDAEHDADVYWVTLHLAIGMSPDEPGVANDPYTRTCTSGVVAFSCLLMA
jgi:hypothetical protein